MTVAPKGSLAWSAGIAMMFIAPLVLVWSFKIDGRQWWKPRRPLLKFKGRLTTVEYQSGSVVEGITFTPGMSHVILWIENVSGVLLNELQLTIEPDKPILKAACRAQMGECSVRIAREVSPPFILTDTGAIPPMTNEEDIVLGLPYRLHCKALPSGDVIRVDFATVTPTLDVMSSQMWTEVAEHPRRITIRGAVSDNDVTENVEKTLTFKKGDRNPGRRRLTTLR